MNKEKNEDFEQSELPYFKDLLMPLVLNYENNSKNHYEY